jgi:hypothetical protein
MKLKGYIVSTCRSYKPYKFPDRNMKYKEVYESVKYGTVRRFKN